MEAARLAAGAEDAVALARQQQCVGASVPMPCFRHRDVTVFHLHFGKMAGRSVEKVGPRLLRLPRCAWFVGSPWENPARFAMSARSKRPANQTACFISHESSWSVVAEFSPPPAVVTMIREPVSWAVSAMLHYTSMGLNDGPAAVIRDWTHRNCFARIFEPECADRLLPSKTVRRLCADNLRLYGIGARSLGGKCAGQRTYPLAASAVMKLNSSCCGGVGDAGFVATAALRLWSDAEARLEATKRASAHLEATVFGLVEYMSPSYCLMQFQLGLWSSAVAKGCDCRSRRAVHNPSSAAALATVHVGERDGHGADEATWLRNVSDLNLSDLKVLQRSMGEHGALYSFAHALFMARIEHVHAVTGTPLLCEL